MEYDKIPEENLKEEKEYRAYMMDVRDFFNKKSGQRLLRAMIDVTGLELNPYSGEETPYYLGRMSIGQEILSLIKEADPTIYPRMLLEEATKEKDDE